MTLGAMGLELAVTVVAGLFIGLKVDEWLPSSPIALLIGLLLGVVAAILRVFHYLKFLKQAERSTEDPEL